MISPGTDAVTRAFASGSEGQIHYYRRGHPDGDTALICVHPLPYSGLFFRTFMELLPGDHLVLAPDLPGYGDSDPMPDEVSVASYAESLWAALADRVGNKRLIVLGFHTGCLVAAEMSLQNPGVIAAMLMVDVPCFAAARRLELLQDVQTERTLTYSLDCLEPAWQFSVQRHEGVVPLDRNFQLFGEQLKAFGRENRGFRAAFSWPADERLPRVSVPVTVLATGSSLNEPSHLAATLIPDAQLIERTDIKRSVFEESARKIAAELTRLVDQT